MATRMNAANARDANLLAIPVRISGGFLAQSSRPVLGLPNSPANRRCGRLQRASHGPAHQEEGERQKARLREDSLKFQGDGNTVREQNAMLQRALNGDQQALGFLVAPNMPRLYRAALRILGVPQDAEEALQDGLLQVVQHFREFEGRSRFSTWLTRVVINASLMRLRRRRREAVTSFDQPPARDEQPFTYEITDHRPNPEEIYVREERLQIFKHKLRSLPSACRSALWLRDVEGMSTREAAEVLGVPLGSLKSQLYRARRKLIRDSQDVRRMHSSLRKALETGRHEAASAG